MPPSRTAPYVVQTTRRTLRGLLGRAFQGAPEYYADHRHGRTLTDVQMLRLLSGLTLTCHADWERAEQVYNAPGLPVGSVPTLQALLDRGEVFRLWGRVRWSWGRRQSVSRNTPEELTGLKARWSSMTGWSHRLSPDVEVDADLSAAAANFVKNEEKFVCRTPVWVAARLWETMNGTAQALRQWVDLWGVLGFPEFSPSGVWGEEGGRAFRGLVLTMLQAEKGFRGWAVTGQPMVSRAVGQAENYQQFLDAGSVCEDMVALLNLLLMDLETEVGARVAEKTVATVFDLCQISPDLLVGVEFITSKRPALLADLLLHPPCSALACFLIADRYYAGGAEDQQVAEAAFYAAQRDAFTYAVSILGEFLQAETTPPAEAAALLLRLYQNRQRRRRVDQTDALIAALRRELSQCRPDVLVAMVETLDIGQGMGSPDFSAALDLCGLGADKGPLDAEALVTAYVQSIREGDYPVSWSRLTSAEAAMLAQLSGQTQALRDDFLQPVNIRNALEAATEYQQTFSIRRGLAAHVSVLCRAVLGSLRDLPEDLFTALVAAVKAAAIAHDNKGRVYALSGEAGSDGHADTALVADLAAVLRTLKVSAEQKEALLVRILETDEPLLLAQMMSRVPDDLKPRFEARINALPPEEANESGLCPTRLERVDALLTAGALRAAEVYLAHEETYPAGEGRTLMRFRLRLRLLFLREDWQAIRGATVPDSGLTKYEQKEAEDLLNWYRVLTEITGEHADPVKAKAFFEQRFQTRPTAENLTNWLAAVICWLLPENTFARLEGEALREGWKAFEAFEQMQGHLLDRPSGPIFDGNRAVLLLSLGEADQAVEILSALAPDLRTEREEAFRAVALARCGRVLEATAVLDAADSRFQDRAVLEGARKHISHSLPYLMAPEVSVLENLHDNIASAIARFERLSGPEQAKVLRKGEEPLLRFLTETVRYAGAEVVSLRPAMQRVLKKEDENTVTDLLERYLRASVRYLGWSITSQSRGGKSKSGNMGERDLVVKDSGSNGELAVIEAVVSRGSVQKKVLSSHFKKLFGYSDAKIIFHVTYAIEVDVGRLVSEIRCIAENDCPEDYTFLEIKPITFDGGKDEASLPPGFIGRYRRERHDAVISMVFIVLDLDQGDQRRAAEAAGRKRGLASGDPPLIAGPARRPRRRWPCQSGPAG